MAVLAFLAYSGTTSPKPPVGRYAPAAPGDGEDHERYAEEAERGRLGCRHGRKKAADLALEELRFVDVAASWCLTCKVNEAAALDRAPVLDRLRDPGAVALAMRQKKLRPYRQRIVGQASGRVLETGVSSALNLPLYGPDVHRVAALDRSRPLLRRGA